MQHAGGGKPHLFVRLSSDAFNLARQKFGDTCHFGRGMPRELVKSWTYLQEGWNTCARTPVTSAIESVATGDSKSVTFHLFGDGLPKSKKKKKTKNKNAPTLSLQLLLPEGLDAQVDKIAALTKHFNLHYDEEQLHKLYSDPVQYQQTQATPAATSKYDPSKRFAMVMRDLKGLGVHDSDMIQFVDDLSLLAADGRRPVHIIEQWHKVLSVCSSHWCPPPVWWCIGSMLVNDNLVGMTRSFEGGVKVPATCLENWDMSALIKLLQCNLFSDEVRKAVCEMNKYARNDIAHERFDLDWHRDWSSMADLLDALKCPNEAAKLRDFCGSKGHANDGGEEQHE